MIAAMKRREFITLVGGAIAWPLAAYAQQAGKKSRVGYLGVSPSDVACHLTLRLGVIHAMQG